MKSRRCLLVIPADTLTPWGGAMEASDDRSNLAWLGGEFRDCGPL